jgi:spore coat polysaccharide biosynthesis predicted glycosyltransferase SpsG
MFPRTEAMSDTTLSLPLSSALPAADIDRVIEALMSACADLRVLFRAPAGARRGFGHLVRCRSLARALGVRPLIALRGRESAVDTALALGCDVVLGDPNRLLPALKPHVLIVDDPVAADAKRWIQAARAAGSLVATVHDLGIGCHDGDLLIDGSIEPVAHAGNRRLAMSPGDRGAGGGDVPTTIRPPTSSAGRNGQLPYGWTHTHDTHPARHLLVGTEFAVLDPAMAARHARRPSRVPRVLIALGGGPRIALARQIAEEIVEAQPDAEIRIATGFVAEPPRVLGGPRAWGGATRIAWIGAQDGLAGELRRSTVAVVGGGVLLYEACALGVASVGVPVVPSQRPTVAAFVKHGAARGHAQHPSPRVVAAEAVRLLRDGTLRACVAERGRRLVDGRGARRAASAVAALVREHT